MTKILVTGANGQLGSELQFLAANHPGLAFIFTDVSDLDITRKEDVLSYFKEHNFDYCINCAAYTAVDKAEEDRELCDRINVLGTRNLAEGCKKVNAVLFQISTDFVFDGTASKPLTEETATSPVNYYGLSKLNGELAVQQVFDKYFIIRTSWLYSIYGSNFVKTMLRLAETKKELGIIADQIGTPTYAWDLANSIIAVVESRSSAYGTYHYSNEGVASWYDFTSAIFEYTQKKTKVNPIRTEQYPTPARRPHYSVMDKQKFKFSFGLTIPHWRESLKKCLSDLEAAE